MAESAKGPKSNSRKLVEAVENQDHQEMQRLLKLKDVDVNFQDQWHLHGFTPLHWAAFNLDTAAAEMLLAHNARVDICDQYGYTCLHIAAYKQAINIVKLLKKAGADLYARNQFGQTPHDAAFSTSAHLTAELLPKDGASTYQNPFLYPGNEANEDLQGK